MPQVKTWLQTKLKREELEVFERPDQVLADALGKGLAKLAARKPLLMVLDTYEVVDRPECDAVVRLVMKAAGGRVSWVVAGRSNLRNSDTRGGIYFNGYGNDFPEAKIYAKALDQFGDAEIREYFARKVPDRPIDDADAQAIREFSLGIPLVVAEIVSIWRACPQLSWQQILAPAPVDDAQNPRDQVIAIMTKRFLFHCLQQGRDEATRKVLTEDLAAIYGLAIVRRPNDHQLLRAMLQTDDLSATLANLQERYSFVFADEFRLHDNLLAYLRPYLLAAARRESPAVQGLNDRALAHLNERLAANQQEWPELGDRFESENAKALWLDAAHHHFWKAQDPDRDETVAWKFWLGVFVDAWLVNRLFAYELVQVLGGFERCLSPDGRRRYERFKGDWYKKYEFDCEARKALLNELDKLARRGWLTIDQHPERTATLELERARLLYGQKQDSAAFQALAALDHRWTNPSPALRKEIADLYDDLASCFLWPDGIASTMPSPKGLQAAQRAYQLQPNHTGYVWQWAVALDQAQRYQEAVEIYQQAIHIDPNYIYAYSGLGNVYRKLKQHYEAITTFQKAINIDPNYVYAYYELGNVYRELKEHDEAITAFQQAINIDPNYVYAYSGLGNVYRELKKYDEAITTFQKAINIDPNYVYAYCELGNVYRNLKQYNEAIIAFQKAINIDPGYVYAYCELGSMYRNLKQYNEAIVAFQKAISVNPIYAASHNRLGDVYRDLKQYENAEASYQKAIDLDSEIAYYYTDLGDLYYSMKRYKEAITAFQQAINIDPSYIRAHNKSGLAHLGLKQYKEGISAVQKAIDLALKDTSSYNELNDKYSDLNRHRETIVTIQTIFNLISKNTSIQNELDSPYLDLDQYKEVVVALQKLIELNPGEAIYYYNLGDSYCRLQQYDEAIITFQKVLKLDPKHVDAYNGLGSAYYRLMRYEEAIFAYQQAIDLNPQNTASYSTLGLLQFETGNLAGAIATFQKVAELDPNDVNLPGNLGFLYLVTDRLDEAETYLLKARELKPSFYMPAFNLAAVRALRSDLDSARSLLAESLQLCPKNTDQEQLHWSIISILLGNIEAGFEQLTNTLATLTNPTEICVIRGGVLEASQAIARSPLQTPDLHRAIDLLQSHLTPKPTDP